MDSLPPRLGGTCCLLEVKVSKQISYSSIFLAVTEMGGRGWGSSQNYEPCPASRKAA